MRNKNQRRSTFKHILHTLFTFFLEILIPHGKHFINHENLGLDGGGYGKPQAGFHARGEIFYGNVNELLYFREVDDLVKVLPHVFSAVSEDGSVKIDVFPGGKLPVESGAELYQGGDRAAACHRPLIGLENAADQLEQRRLS